MAADDPKTIADRETATFSVDAGLLYQLGEELVNKPSVALSELIKNSYDADATEVRVIFSPLDQPHTLTISDNGSGIASAAFRSSWMTIGTADKVTTPYSIRFRRPRAGAKGVGRFATRRLANALRLRSVAQLDDGRFQELEVSFDWDAFVRGSAVNAVSVPFTVRDLGSGPHDTGTSLQLRGLRERWDAAAVEAVADELALLFSEDRGRRVKSDVFHIYFSGPGFPTPTRLQASRWQDQGLATLKGTLEADGSLSYEARFKGDKKTLSFSPEDVELTSLGPCRFDLGFFVYKKEHFGVKGMTLRQAQQRGRTEGGVRIYMDGFRVPPYGDTGDDWLRLDEDRGRRAEAHDRALDGTFTVERPLLNLPGNNQLFGRVVLSRAANPGLKQTVNRERFIEGAEFAELRRFVRLGIDWLTVKYAERTEGRRRKKVSPTDSLAGNLHSAVEAVKAIPPGSIDEYQRRELVRVLSTAENSVRERETEFVDEISMLRVLASTGTMVLVFDHQIMASLSGLRRVTKTLSGLSEMLPKQTFDKIKGQIVELNTAVQDLSGQAEMLGLLLGRESRNRRRRVRIHEVCETVARSFDGYMRDHGIEFRNKVPANAHTPNMFPAEVAAIVVNLFTNALKAVRGTRVRHIEATARTSARETAIVISDTGVGADPDHWDDYFNPFFGTSVPDPVLGVGTGLGLKIVRDSAAIYGGTAEFVAPDDPWRTTVVVRLPM